jgi:hypothetical protein
VTTPSEVQLDLAAGVRARLEGETADPGAQVLARMRLACRDPATGGAAPVRTVRPTCAVPLDIMDDCRRRCEPFPTRTTGGLGPTSATESGCGARGAASGRGPTP